MKSIYFFVISVIFASAAIFHFLRLMFEWRILIETCLLPSWTSGLIIIISILIVYWSFQINKKEELKNKNEESENNNPNN